MTKISLPRPLCLVHAVLGTMTALLAFASPDARAATVFQQNFDGPGPYFSANPDNTQFDGIADGGNFFDAAVTGGALQVTRSGASSGAIVRSTDLATSNSAVQYQFNFNVTSITSAAATTSDIDFQIGSGYVASGNGSTSAQSDVTFAQFFFDLQTTTTYGIYLSSQQGGSTASLNVGTNYLINFYANRTAAPVGFLAPDGTTQTLSAASVTLYVGNTIYINNFAATATNPGQSTMNDLTDFKLRFAADQGTFQADNFLIQTIPEPSSWAWVVGGLTMLGVFIRHQRSRANW